jgi:hypothetical protein
VKFEAAGKLIIDIFRLPENIYTKLSLYMRDFGRFQVFTAVVIDWSVGLLGVICCVRRPTAAAVVVELIEVIILVMLCRKKLPNIQKNLLSYLKNRSAVSLLELDHNSERLHYVTYVITYYYSHE